MSNRGLATHPAQLSPWPEEIGLTKRKDLPKVTQLKVTHQTEGLELILQTHSFINLIIQ
jgi:hypothetical protein